MVLSTRSQFYAFHALLLAGVGEGSSPGGMRTDVAVLHWHALHHLLLLPHEGLEAEVPLLDLDPDMDLYGEEMIIPYIRQCSVEPLCQTEDIFYIVTSWSS